MAYRNTARMQEQKAARRRRFLDVATRLFGAKGYHQTTVPEVVGESGSSTGSFYFYFDNKEDLFAQVLGQIGDRLSSKLNEAIANQSEPPQQMRAAVEGVFLFLAENPAEARILVVESSGLGGRLEQTRREIQASHTRSVERAIRRLSGRVASADPAVLARCWVGAIYEVIRYWLEIEPGERPPAGQIATEVAQFNLRGIAAN